MKKVFLLIPLIFITSTTYSAEINAKKTLAEEYWQSGQETLLMCKAMFLLASTEAASRVRVEKNDTNDYIKCIENGKVTAKKSILKALKTIKKEKAQESLKSVHAALITALSGIEPGVSERKISYEQRQQELNDELTKAWARFEVEQ